MTKLYRDFRPTGFDPAGLALDEQQDWIVAPVIQTRDSGVFDRTNFQSALEILGGESETCEVHRFGHWGPGWFEIIIVSPEREKEIEDIERALENYPVLDDEALSNNEWDEYLEDWQNYAERDFVRGLCNEFQLCPSAENAVEDCDSDTLREFYEKLTPSGEFYFQDGDSLCIRTDRAVDRCTRDQMAEFLNGIRAAARKTQQQQQAE